MAIQLDNKSTVLSPAEQFSENGKAIVEKIDQQFQKALKEVNEYAETNNLLGIRAEPIGHGHKHITRQEPFKFLNRYKVYIYNEIKSYNDMSTFFNHRVPDLLSLGNIPTSPYTIDELNEMAKLSEVPDLTEVYEHWKQKFKHWVDFCNNHSKEIFQVKEAVNEQFIRAIKDAHLHVETKGWQGFHVGSGFSMNNDNFSVELYDNMKFEPFEDYFLWKNIPGEKDGRESFYMIQPFSGTIDEFEEIVENNLEYDFEKVYEVAITKMKERIDRKAYAAGLASFCSIL
ncbi:MAG: hypothetical protein AAGG81_08845 [Chlamydiota bacterium]